MLTSPLAGKAGQLWGNLGGAASVGEYVGHRRRRRTSPGAVVRRVRPELASPGPASSWVNHRHRRLIAEDPRRGVDGSQLQLVEAFEPPRGALHPQGQRRAVEMHT